MAKKRGNLAAFGGLNIILLGIVSLLNDFSSEMILPILPLLITSIGGTGLTIGIIGGLIEGLPHLLKVFTGYLSDIFRKRKLFIFLGYLNSQVFKFLLVFANTWKGILAFVSLDKLGKGIREAPRDALIAESMPEHKGKAFGIQRAFDTTGAILGSVSALLIVIFFGLVFKSIILIAALIGFISLVPLYFLKDVDHLKIKKPLAQKPNFLRDTKKIPASLWIFFSISGIFALANFSYMFFVVRAAGASFQIANLTPFAIPILLYVLFNIVYAIFAIPF